MIGPMTSRPTSNTLNESQTQVHMVTWFGVELDKGVTPGSQQGHLKVTGRTNQLHIALRS